MAAHAAYKEKITHPIAIKRITRELLDIQKNPLYRIFINVNEEDIGNVDALIMGPEDTPYECGFFYFTIKFPVDYPSRPPHVLIQTTDSGRVRFNPNLYKDGKVCLSILGTWSGPSWTPALTLSSVLLALQAQIMVDFPLRNEPGHDNVPMESLKKYNEVIAHETLRVALCGFLEGSSNAPQQFVDLARKIFIEGKLYRKAKEFCKKYKTLNGSKSNTFQNSIVFNFKEIEKRIKNLKENLKEMKE